MNFFLFFCTDEFYIHWLDNVFEDILLSLFFFSLSFGLLGYISLGIV